MNAAVIALLFLPLLHCASAHSYGLDAQICENFAVRHTGSNEENDSHEITLEVLENGEPVNCFVPQTEYQVSLSSSTGVIKGFILQAKSGAKLPSDKQNIPVTTTWGPCDNSVSHTEARSSSSPDLIFPIRTGKSKRPLMFRYTVVFSFGAFQQDRYWELPSCPEMMNTSNETSTEPPTAVNVTELEPVENHNCGKTVNNIMKQVNHTHQGIRYNCTINKPLKQTECVESCDYEGRPIYCQIATHTPRRKGYTCQAYQDGQDLTDLDLDNYMRDETFNEVVTNNCQCYYMA